MKQNGNMLFVFNIEYIYIVLQSLFYSFISIDSNEVSKFL